MRWLLQRRHGSAMRRALRLLLWPPAVSAAAPTRPPNVIWVLIDDFGYNDIGFHNKDNEAQLRTPNMDAMAASEHGIRLERFYSQPICTPTRSQALSGRYQIHTGLQHGVLWKGQINGLPPNETTVADHLQQLGYATHGIGKWHVGMSNLSMTPLRRGFDTFFGFWGGSEDHWTHHAGAHLDFRDGEGVARNYSSSDRSNASYSSHLFTGRAVRIIQDADSPFFIYLAYQATHAPLQAPKEVVDSFSHIKDNNRRVFAAMAAVVDEGIGNVTRALRESGELGRTVIFLSGDNGGTVRAGGNNWPLRGFKGSLWEGGCRASAFVYSPLLPARPNYVWRGLFHVSDWLPTTLELAGARSLPPELDGYAMWGALLSGGDSPRAELVHEIDRIAEPRYSCSGPIAPLDGDGAQMDLPPVFDRFVRAAIHTVINGTHWKLVVGECAGWDTDSTNIPPPGYTPPAPPPLPPRCGAPPGCAKDPCPQRGPWLFDVDSDEAERCDLSAAEPAVLAEAMARLAAYEAGEVPVRYPNGSPLLDPSRCEPKLDYWFAADEAEPAERCHGRPPLPPPDAPTLRLAAGGACLSADPTGLQWAVLGDCNGTHAEWSAVEFDRPELWSRGVGGSECLNVYGGMPQNCTALGARMHLAKCGAGHPGDSLRYDHGSKQLTPVSEPKCKGLCVAPTTPYVSLQACSEATVWEVL